MKKFGIILFVTQFNLIFSEELVSYKGYRIYEVTEDGLDKPPLNLPKSDKDFEVLNEFHAFEGDLPKTVRSYLVPASEERDFRRVLDLVKAGYNIVVPDVYKSIQEERRSLDLSSRRSESEWKFQTNVYYTYEEMEDYLNFVTSIKNPANGEPLAVLENIGKSFEGRKLHLVKISSDHSGDKPIIFFEAGIHAREWTAPVTALYMVYQLVENYTATKDVLSDIDFYIVPLTNPDGYEYSRTTNRLWRKTRSVHKNHFGVDGNRNFDFHWGEKGTSADPRSEIYKGPFPFSEPETRGIRYVGHKYKPRINAFVSIHAFGPQIVYPWSYARTEPAPQTYLMNKVGREAADAIHKYNGTYYLVGVSSVLMYEAAGGADDYFKGVLGVDLSYTVELSSAGEKSFIVPTSKLLGISSEAFEGFKVIAKNAAYYKNVANRSGKRNRKFYD